MDQAFFILNNLRAAHQDLAARVTRAVQTHRGDPAFLNSHRQEVASFTAEATHHRQIFSPQEYADLCTSVDRQLASLYNASVICHDPPDASAIDNPMVFLVHTGLPGRPRVHIQTPFLTHVMAMGGPYKNAAEIGCSSRTIRRRAIECGLRDPCPPVFSTVNIGGEDRTVLTTATPPVSTLSDSSLDQEVLTVLRLFPLFGRRMIQAGLLTSGHRVPIERIEKAFLRVWGAPTAFGHRPIMRKTYWVPGVNSLWHHDGNHDLIQYKFVVHAFIDGKSRYLTGIRAHSNNRAETVVTLFRQAVAKHGWPSRLRGDHGGENVMCAQDMEEKMGPNRGSYIWGSSPHNSRIERCWLDYAHGIVAKWKPFLMELEGLCGLKVDDQGHIWLLHHIFLNLLNRDIERWQNAWNMHKISLPEGGRRTPHQLFVLRTHQDGPRGMNVGDISSFGVDWADRRSIASAFSRQREEYQPVAHNPLLDSTQPSQLSFVVCEEPDCPLSDRNVQWLDMELCSRVDVFSDDMAVRKLMWIIAFSLYSTIIPPT